MKNKFLKIQIKLYNKYRRRFKNAFVKKYYNIILALHGEDLLRGFGNSNAYDDFLQENAEIRRLSFKHN